MASLVISSCQNNIEQDIVVIGGGLMGSAAAWELSKHGQNVLLIEQQDSIYTYGSSFGEARISRSLGPQNDIFSYLQQTSVTETQKLISYLNEVSNSKLHSMEDIYSSSPVTYIYGKSQQHEVNLLLDGQLDRYEYAPNSEKALEMFDMTIPDSLMVIREYKEFSGTLNPKVLISKLHQGIKNSGSEILYNEKVASLKRKNDHYEIEITNTKTEEKRVISSKKVVSAAGPYTGTLVKSVAPYFNQLITPKRLFLAFFKLDKNTFESFTTQQKKRLHEYYPIINDFDPDMFYSMIEKYDEDGAPILKIGGHFLRTDVKNLDEVWQKDLTQNEIEWSKNNTLTYFNVLNMSIDATALKFYKGYSCVYSLTETGIPYVTNVVNDNNETDPNFVVVGGMSGIGAKGSLAYGLIATNLLLNKENTTNIYQKTKTALGFNRLLEDKDLVDN
jgi:glycine/D-amino acid oxidase-like deaminating enzyme